MRAVVDVAPGTLVVYSDLGCPWSHVAVHQLLEARRRLGLEGRVVLDHRAFPLELFNRRPTPKNVLDGEIPVAGALDPGAGWQLWQDHAWRYPVSTLLGMEAVQAAKEQGLDASERLDRALRVAFFGESRCITMRHVILEVAEATDGVDADALAKALDDGRARQLVMDHRRQAEEGPVKGSPHVFCPDGVDDANPGVAHHWEGEEGRGFPVVDRYDAGVYEDLVRRGAGA